MVKSTWKCLIERNTHGNYEELTQSVNLLWTAAMIVLTTAKK
jgi:hypothetical protein